MHIPHNNQITYIHIYYTGLGSCPHYWQDYTTPDNKHCTTTVTHTTYSTYLQQTYTSEGRANSDLDFYKYIMLNKRYLQKAAKVYGAS